jgi:hypothetical protein
MNPTMRCFFLLSVTWQPHQHFWYPKHLIRNQWPYCYFTFEYDFYTPKSSNQNTVFIGDNNLIGHYFKYNDKILIWKYFDHKARIEWNNPKRYKNKSIKNPNLMEIIISLATPSSTLYYILFLPWLACGRMLLPMTELNSNCCLRQLRTLATLVGWVNGILLTITAGCSSEHPLISFI